MQFWGSLIKNAAKYGPGIIRAINDGEAQDYDDDDYDAEMQKINWGKILKGAAKGVVKYGPSVLDAINDGEAQGYDNDDYDAEMQKINWGKILKGAAKGAVKYGPSVLDAINGGEAQGYDDDAEAQWIGAALGLASALAPLLNGSG